MTPSQRSRLASIPFSRNPPGSARADTQARCACRGGSRRCIEPYVGAGIGIYHAALESSQATLTARVNKSDNGIGLQLLAGVEYYFGDSGNSVGIQYRRLKLEVSFGPEVAGTVDVGGDFLFLMFRRTF